MSVSWACTQESRRMDEAHLGAQRWWTVPCLPLGFNSPRLHPPHPESPRARSMPPGGVAFFTPTVRTPQKPLTSPCQSPTQGSCGATPPRPPRRSKGQERRTEMKSGPRGGLQQRHGPSGHIPRTGDPPRILQRLKPETLLGPDPSPTAPAARQANPEAPRD